MTTLRDIVARAQRADRAERIQPASCAIVRSPLHTAGFALVALACAGGAAAVVTLALPLVALTAGLTLALGAILFGVAAVYGAWRAACPACDGQVAFPSPHGVRACCAECHAELESIGGRACLAATPTRDYDRDAPRESRAGGVHAARQAHGHGDRDRPEEPGAARVVAEGRQAA